MATKGRGRSKGASKSAPQKNLVPVYVLTIMALATVVVVMMNRTPDTGGNTGGKSNAVHNARLNDTTPADDTIQKDTSETTKDENIPLKKVKIYFLVYNERTGKILPGPVAREVKGDNEISRTLAELVKGPTGDEEKKGLISAMPDDLVIRSVVVKGGIAEIDCSPEFRDNAHGDILTGRLNQLYYTATQFPSVKGILIKINGKPLSVAGGEGLMLIWPMRKPM
jgi:spore germination protein GerM